jgi:hypothetical protein
LDQPSSVLVLWSNPAEAPFALVAVGARGAPRVPVESAQTNRMVRAAGGFGTENDRQKIAHRSVPL